MAVIDVETRSKTNGDELIVIQQCCQVRSVLIVQLFRRINQFRRVATRRKPPSTSSASPG